MRLVVVEGATTRRDRGLQIDLRQIPRHSPIDDGRRVRERVEERARSTEGDQHQEHSSSCPWSERKRGGVQMGVPCFVGRMNATKALEI